MVICHEPSHYTHAPPEMMTSGNNGYSRAVQPPYHHPSGHHHHLSHSHHGHGMHQQPHFHQPHTQRYYASHPPTSQLKSSPPLHHPHSQSPSHHAAVTLQSMQQHYHTYYPTKTTHYTPQASLLNSPKPSENKLEGFHMLIAAATSESMNSIDEDKVKTVAAKGILKKHQRGKQLVSPLESVENSDKEVEESNIKSQGTRSKVETQSAGPLKKRRKANEETVTAQDRAVSVCFLEKLHKFLNDNLEPHALEWLPHGKAFRVLRWDVLAGQVLPHVLGKETDVDAMIQLFRGQLKEYGFVELKHGKDYGSYCHEFFVKNEPDWINKIYPSNNLADLSPTCNITHSGSSDTGMEWRSTGRVAHSIFKLPGTENNDKKSHPSYLHMPVLTATATASFAENWGSDEDGSNHHQDTNCHGSRSTSNANFPSSYPLLQNSPQPTEYEQDASERSPKIIRFQEDEESSRSHSQVMYRHASRLKPAIEISPNDAGHKALHYDTVQMSPNPDCDQAKIGGFKPHFPVSRRGGRGGGMMRPVSSCTSRYVTHISN